MPESALRSRLSAAALDCLEDEHPDIEAQGRLPQEIVLLGPSAMLDSIGLVAFLVAFEERMARDFAIDLTLMDERALSQTKSPFRNIATLLDYVVERLEEGKRD